MNKIYADVSEDENVDEPNFQWVVLASEAEEREDALQEELAKFKAGCVDLSSQVRELEHKMDYYKGEGLRADALQQRLTIAEERISLLEKPCFEDWEIDTTAGRPILVYKQCSVIEDEQAYQIVRMIEAAKSAE